MLRIPLFEPWGVQKPLPFCGEFAAGKRSGTTKPCMFRGAKPCRNVTNSRASSFAMQSTHARSTHPKGAKKSDIPRGYIALFGAPAENRTPDTLIKSQVLYQLSYRGVNFVCFAKCGEFATRVVGVVAVPPFFCRNSCKALRNVANSDTD